MSSNKNKKLKELNVLRLVYKQNDYPNVIENEQPDFIIEDIDTRFGVEVTEYYQDDSSGRYANIPNYMSRILDEGYLHKEDRGSIEVVHPVVTLTGGATVRLNNMVWRPILSFEERINRLAKIIEFKNERFKNYNGSLSSIDLLIYDHGDLLAGRDGTAIQKHLENLSSSSSNLQTPFKNIYLYIAETGRPVLICLWAA